MNDDTDWFGRLSTPIKILLILSLALLPIGLGAAWIAKRNLDGAYHNIEMNSRDKAVDAASAVQALIGRNALATRLAANAALRNPTPAACDDARRVLAVSPAFGKEFSLEDSSGARLCAVGDMGEPGRTPAVAPGDIRVWIDSSGDGIYARMGVVNGSATVHLVNAELIAAIKDGRDDVRQASLKVGEDQLDLIAEGSNTPLTSASRRIVRDQIEADVGVQRATISPFERLIILLPLLMWGAAAIVSWWMIHRLLIRPLRRLETAVTEFQPGDDANLVLPPGLGPAKEIHELGSAFQRTVERVEGAERDARDALEGQRKLVREVHHRVKNNLQVVASLLSIHGRTATEPEAQAAYSAIGRRVDALSVVHRNHYAELEENRGIALRPLLTELAAGLRASAPNAARQTPFDLDLENCFTTQDVAVAAAFLITEIVEFAMLREPGKPVQINLRRNSELTATLSIESAVLVPEGDPDDKAKVQFERIIEGLARQLRSPLERRLGRYTVTLPIFPER